LNEKEIKKQANASVKSKELQPKAQTDTGIAYLLLPQRKNQPK